MAFYFPHIHPLPTPTPFPPRPTPLLMSGFHYLQDQPLSPFQQTLREQEEKFFQTFPDARNEYIQDPYAQPWNYSFSDGHLLAGTGFQLNAVNTLHYDHTLPPSHTLPQTPSHSSLTQAVDPSLIGHTVQVQQNQQTAYATPYASPPSACHDPFAISTTLPSSISTSASDIPHFERAHQLNMSSPVMDSLPSPGSSSDPSSFHGSHHSPPQTTYYQPSPPFNSTPSPPHHELSAPLSPPALVPAAYPYEIPGPEHRSYFPDQLPSPPDNAASPAAPSRREGPRRARRTTPPYARPPNHRSGGTRGTLPMPNPNIGWSPSSSNAVPSMAISSNAAGAFVNMMSSSVAGQTAGTIAPVSITGPSEVPPVSSSGKRNPDKKPALACVFCRGRKIACGPPTEDGDGKTCNQCQRRSLRCEYPTESRRGMRKKPSNTTSTSSTSTAGTSSKAGKSDNATSDPKVKSNAETTTPKTVTNKKR